MRPPKLMTPQERDDLRLINKLHSFLVHQIPNGHKVNCKKPAKRYSGIQVGSARLLELRCHLRPKRVSKSFL